MNTCILMAEVIDNPELRKTTNDRDVANMTVQFPGLKDDDPSATMRVVGWGNLGIEMSQSYSSGDRVIIEGRLSMKLVEREGYKEKVAELTASRIYPVGGSQSMSAPTSTPSKVVNMPTAEPEISPQYTAAAALANQSEEYQEETLDEIPF